MIHRHIDGFDGQLSTLWHGVSCIDGQIDDRRFEVVEINFDLPKPGASDGLHLDVFTERSLQKVLQAIDEVIDVERLWIERLAAREGQEPAG